MMLEAAGKWDLSLPESYVVGDRWRDVEAGARAGCYTILVDRGWKERQAEIEPNARVNSALGAANWIVRHQGEK